MKATGIIRRIDDLGRIVIPKEIRRTLHLREGDPMEIYTDQDVVCFKKYSFISDYAATATALVETLKRKGVKCALYDNSDCKICGDTNAPSNMEYDAFNSNHFAINVDGDFCGYLAIANITPENKPLIEFTIIALAKIITLN